MNKKRVEKIIRNLNFNEIAELYAFFVWYDIEYDKIRMWPNHYICNEVAEFDEYMLWLGVL